MFVVSWLLLLFVGGGGGYYCYDLLFVYGNIVLFAMGLHDVPIGRNMILYDDYYVALFFAGTFD